jgi:hypothetical protein
VLAPPTVGCPDGGTRPVVPTGLQLHLQGARGLVTVYAPVGLSVSAWLMDAYTRACPARPQGPPAVPGS